MKIGIDASRYSHSQATGVEWYSWHIINSLVDEIIHSEDEVALYSRENLDLSKWKSSKLSNRVLKAKRFWTLKALSKEMRKNPPDVLFVPSHTLPPSLPRHSVITIHDVAFKHIPDSYSFFQRQYLNWSTKFAVKNATRIIVPSQTTKDDLVNFYNCSASKIAVVKHGFTEPEKVDADIFKKSEIFRYFGITASSKYLLYVGRLERKKNLVRLVEAFSEVLKTNPDFRLILAGKRGVGFNDILKTVDKLELMHKVVMSGYITEEEKNALYKYCRVFAFPSLYEGFGLPILEAFYYEKPVLCSKVASLMEVGDDAVQYINPADTKTITDGLKKLIEDGEYAEELTKKGKELLRNYSWKKAATETLKILKG